MGDGNFVKFGLWVGISLRGKIYIAANELA